MKTVINSIEFDWASVLRLVNKMPAKAKLLDGLRLVDNHSNNFMITLTQVFNNFKDSQPPKLKKANSSIDESDL